MKYFLPGLAPQLEHISEDRNHLSIFNNGFTFYYLTFFSFICAIIQLTFVFHYTFFVFKNITRSITNNI